MLEAQDAEAAEDAERRSKGLPPLPKPRGPKGPQPGTIQITVGGEKRTVPAPPAGAYYDKQGALIRPQRDVTRRF